VSRWRLVRLVGLVDQVDRMGLVRLVGLVGMVGMVDKEDMAEVGKEDKAEGMVQDMRMDTATRDMEVDNNHNRHSWDKTFLLDGLYFNNVENTGSIEIFQIWYRKCIRIFSFSIFHPYL
jgi:hypothetical protein